MVNKTELTYTLFCLLLFTTSMAIYGFLSKGKASPAVVVSVSTDSINVNDEDLLINNRFWENYPILILKTKQEPLNAQFLLEVGVDIKNLVDSYLTFSGLKME